MKIKLIIIASLLAISAIANCQPESEINKTDPEGKKQGHWIKKYPGKSVLYEGYFKDDHPVGEFKRYYEDEKLKSLLIYNSDGTEAAATIYHPNGFIAAKGRYVNQMKEGKWQFFSFIFEGYLISEETYSGNLKNGPSVKFYRDSTIAERINYVNDVRQGDWIRYYPTGEICFKSHLLNGILNGRFEVWFENGQIEFSGQYKNDAREGLWFIYNSDGTIKYSLEYKDGFTRDLKLDIDESAILDSLENNAGKIADPEKSGVIR